jgi:hypothetical protein
MRWAMKYLIATMAALIIAVSLNTASAAGEDISDLESLISSNEDTHMDSQDLAFFLATHNFDATPMGSYVVVNLDNKVYRLIPNGEEPGLCRIAF